MSESTELTIVQRAAVALKSDQHEQELRALATKYADITEIKNPAGREQAHGAMMELVNRRVTITKAGKEARDDATKYSKAVIEEEKRLVALIEPEETRLRGLRDKWDAEREREKAAKAAAEKARVDGIRKRIAEIQAIPAMLVGKQSETIAAAIESLETVEITLETFEECAGEADMVKAVTIQKLGEMLTAQLAAEAEAKRLQEERAELERLRAEQAERERVAAAERAEQERVARVAREAEEARLKAEREAHEAELHRQREAEEARLKYEREAEEARLAEQRAEIARQQAEIAAAKAEAERVERERVAAIEAEARAKREAEEAAARAEAEKREAALRAEAIERARRIREDFELNGPHASEMIDVLANHYQVEQQTVLQWINRWVWAEVEIAA
jgi:hypothetical protein